MLFRSCVNTSLNYEELFLLSIPKQLLQLIRTKRNPVRIFYAWDSVVDVIDNAIIGVEVALHKSK